MSSDQSESPRSSSSWTEVVAGGDMDSESRKDQSQQQQVQKLMKLAGSLFEERGYAGTIEVSWMFGVYQEKAALNFLRGDTESAPWDETEDDEPICVNDLLEKDASRAGGLMRQMLRRLEDRAKTWTGDVPDNLAGIASSHDPLLGAVGSIGFSLFGVVGWSISISISVYSSRLRRWRQRVDRSWALAHDAPRWRPLFEAISSPAGLVSGAAVLEAMTTRDELRDAVAGVARVHLRDAWHLADVTRDGSLDFEEFVLFLHLISWARAAPSQNGQGMAAGNNNNKALPLYLPANLVPPAARKNKRNKKKYRAPEGLLDSAPTSSPPKPKDLADDDDEPTGSPSLPTRPPPPHLDTPGEGPPGTIAASTSPAIMVPGGDAPSVEV
ncbi:hypothetical protein CTAYLR_010770 [Chrysophaeum taylorii]|uniref:Uncharacterized protein n=1 Tax=Chrysophaeum taylorii TaxID=2483200 RepID=A0AAD7UHY1_9STRA|nr:hypothetical protein CTAYLR_010770 [Chrysophaeum taylorii]